MCTGGGTGVDVVCECASLLCLTFPPHVYPHTFDSHILDPLSTHSVKKWGEDLFTAVPPPVFMVQLLVRDVSEGNRRPKEGISSQGLVQHLHTSLYINPTFADCSP